MPIKNGIEATKTLRQLNAAKKIDLSNTKIYMHSAIQEVIEWEEWFDGYLNKPIQLEELV